MATRETVTRIIGVLAQFYPAFARTQDADAWQALIAAYHLVLYDLEGDLLERAALDLGGRARFFPAAGELRQAALDLADLGQDIPTAQDAWAEVSKRLRRGGFYVRDEWGAYQRRAPRAEDWSHPLIQRALDGVGGWQALKDPQANAAADRARFFEAYNVYAARDRQDRGMLPCVRQAVERIRAGNGARGQPLALPEIIAGITERGAPVISPSALEGEPG